MPRPRKAAMCDAGGYRALRGEAQANSRQALGSSLGGVQLRVRLPRSTYCFAAWGGMLSCGLAAPRPCASGPGQVIACRWTSKYKGILSGFSVTLRDDGLRGPGPRLGPDLSRLLHAGASSSLASTRSSKIRYAELL